MLYLVNSGATVHRGEKIVEIDAQQAQDHIDDVRDSPALDLLPALIESGARVRAFDPEGMAEAKS